MEKITVAVTKKKSLDEGKGAAAVAEQPTIHGVLVNSGDIKHGGTAKKPFVCLLNRKVIHVQKGFNPRTSGLGEIDTLAESIKKDGLLSTPVVRPDADKPGHFLLVAGERRLKACDLIGLEEIPVQIRTDLTGDDDKAKAVAVAENSEDGRTNLNSIEVGRVCKDLEDKGWTVARIASECGLHPMKVRRCLTLVNAPEDVVKKVEKGEISMIAGLELAKLDDDTRKKIKGDLTAETSAAEVKKLAKAAAKESEGATDGAGKPNQKKTGKARDAALYTWQGSKAKQAKIAELAYYIANAGEDKGTGDWHELRGSLAALLWDRGDLTEIMLPNAESEKPADKKALKKFEELVEKEAAKHTPPAVEGEGAEAEPEEAAAGKK